MRAFGEQREDAQSGEGPFSADPKDGPAQFSKHLNVYLGYNERGPLLRSLCWTLSRKIRAHMVRASDQ